MTERYTVWRARELGLGEGSTFEEILEAGTRVIQARLREQLGILPGASWEEIVRAKTDFERQARAEALGLSADAPWSEIVAGEHGRRMQAPRKQEEA